MRRADNNARSVNEGKNKNKINKIGEPSVSMRDTVFVINNKPPQSIVDNRSQESEEYIKPKNKLILSDDTRIADTTWRFLKLEAMADDFKEKQSWSVSNILLD